MNPRVLVVDDEPDVQELVAYNLADMGFDVMRAATGLQGLSLARCGSPEVIVLDLLLPDIDGLSVSEILRAQPSTRDVPVIIFSVLDPPKPGSRGARIGVFRWLTKGSDWDSLGDHVRAAHDEHARRVTCRVAPEDDLSRGLMG